MTIRSRGINRQRKARTTIAVQGARVHNLKNISLEIPRDSLVVVTGLSGSGQVEPRLRHDLRRRAAPLHGVALELREALRRAGRQARRRLRVRPLAGDLDRAEDDRSNPRSTVGTMTDIASYLNLLFATIGEPHCPRTGEPTPSRSASQILEAILSLPEGTEIELRAPVFKVYGEELDFVFTELRKKGCRRLIVDGKPVDISGEVELDDVERDDTWTRSSIGSSSAASTRRRSRRASRPRCSSATA